ncbi:MAG: ATP-dependent helicase [Planctomycetota bacterium]
MTSSWLEELNPAQRQAAAFGDGPLLIVAGAGTGKTRTLVARVASLLQRGVRPDRVLLLTFTRRAADEMRSRVGRLVDSSTAGRVWGGTFHAVANRLLRIHADAVGLSSEFTVMDESDAADLMNLVRGELGLGKSPRRFPRKETLVKVYSHTVNAQRPLRDVLQTHFPWCAADLDGIRAVFEGFVQRKKARQLLDFDDLLLYWSQLCQTARVGELVADRFEHVLVDEYQDTNILQAEILQGMRRRYNNLTVVGDDAQSIYSFRAATVRNILDFPTHFPGAAIVTLEQNYRSIQPILAAANAVMAPAKERYTKELWSTRASEQKPALVRCLDEAEQTKAACDRILEHLERGVPLMRQAVLFRTGHHSADLEIELSRRNIPFRKYGGLKFVEAAHIKDVLALLRILENPLDEVSWFRVLHWLEGVGPRTARRIMEELGVGCVGATALPDSSSTALAIRPPLKRLFDAPPTVPASARELLAELRTAMAYCRGVDLSDLPSSIPAAPGAIIDLDRDDDAHGGGVRPGEPALSTQLDRLRRFYEPVCQRLYDDAAIRLRDVDQLIQIAARYRSRSRLITDLTLDPPRATSDLAQPPFREEDYLVLSTIHSAKGCEWNVVHILHAADGMIPSDMAVADEAGVDEERRLFYVAMTRAKDMLYVYFPLRYYHRRFGHGDAHNFAQLTRFLAPSTLELFEQRLGDAALTRQLPSPDRSIESPHSRVARLWAD